MKTLEPAEQQFFHVEWESTLKCNLDCSYCGDGHDNTQPHPSLNKCLETVDFIFEYVSLYLDTYPNNSDKVMKHVNLNVYGGESLFHPQILDILKYIKEKRKEYDFSVAISTITNAVVGKKHWKKIIPNLDHITVSYHAESTPKQKTIVKNNILHLQENKKNFQVSCMMHPRHWEECVDMVEWCREHEIKVIPRQIDSKWSDFRFNYTEEQKNWLYGTCDNCPKTKILDKLSYVLKNGIDLSSKVRECCGRVPFYIDENYDSTTTVVENKFKGWNCSVNRFFLYIRQTTGQVFTNKDCRQNLENKIGPLGYLNNTDKILKNTRRKIKNKEDFIKCQKTSCWCGMCAPKSKDLDVFKKIMEKYQDD